MMKGNEFRDHWRKESDEIPDDDRAVIVLCEHYVGLWTVTVGYCKDEKWHTLDGRIIRVTHWMDLPDPPEGEEEE